MSEILAALLGALVTALFSWSMVSDSETALNACQAEVVKLEATISGMLMNKN